MILRNYNDLLNLVAQKVSSLEKAGFPERYVVAIDGNCGSGKTTAVRHMAQVLGCEIIQMDDFYLTQEMRTYERRCEPGGNVNYERFSEEVLPHLRSPEPFFYNKYDVPSDSFIDQIRIRNPHIVLIEGAYALRPEFLPYYDLTVFSKASYELQIQRLTKREGEFVEEYKKLWIPLENTYHEFYHLTDRVDIVVDVG